MKLPSLTLCVLPLMFLAGCNSSEETSSPAPAPSPKPAGTPMAKPSAGQGVAPSATLVTVTIDGTGYHPASLLIPAGKPVRVTFSSKEDTCGNEVRLPAIKKSLSLAPGHKKDVTVTLKKGQKLAYACGMEMFKGEIKAR